ncbi:hypothetical protein Tco_0271675 [Tanacetum coccineum]
MYGSKTKNRNSAPRVSCFYTRYHIVPPVLFPLIMAVLHKISPTITIAILILMASVCLLRANKGEDEFSKGIDLKVVHLLFAAVKIVHNSISVAHDELAYDAETMVAQAIRLEGCKSYPFMVQREMVGKEGRLWGLTLTRSIVKKVLL